MGLFFVYILKASVCLTLFYLFYKLLLSRETFHRFNRIALLSLLLLSLLLPLVQLTTTKQTEVHRTVLTLEQLLMMAGQTPGVAVTQAEEATVSWIQVALLFYLAGIVFFACRHLYTLTRLAMLIRSGRREKMEHGVRLIVHAKEIAPFSWMRYIVIAEKDLKENGREILIHEMAHIRNRHSVDLLMGDICIFFQWFNPAAWLLKQELQNIHEYEADETVIKEGVDAKQYQLLLIKKAVGTRLYSMANSFNHSKLKKRITMMLREKSSPWARLKYLYVLPLAAIAVTAFARPEVSNKMEEISAVKVNDLAAIVETKVLETVPKVVNDTVKTDFTPKAIILGSREGAPDFPGGMKACLKYLQDNMQYPAMAKEAGVGGSVVMEFVVEGDGSISSPKVVVPVNPELDKEAIRLITNMPKWIPGILNGKPTSVKFTLPIIFGQTKERTAGAIFRSKSDKDPLLIVDGVEISKKLFYAINPNRIESISVLKDVSAKDVYGEKGKDGVILVTLRTEEGLQAKTDNSSKTSSDEGTIPIDTKVTGKVQDEDGTPIVGAAVLIKGTNQGTIADADGNFVIVAPKDAVLSVSYIGVQTAEVKVSSSPLVVTLKEEQVKK